MTKRPTFTIAEVVDRFDVSRSTLRRGITDGRFPSAAKDSQGRWVINVDDLLQAGYTARKTWLNEPVHDHGGQTSTFTNENAVLSEHGQLQADLAHERAQVEKLQALLEAERSHVESLRMALRMIEPAPSPDDNPEPEKEKMTRVSKSPEKAPVSQKGFFSRLFHKK